MTPQDLFAEAADGSRLDDLGAPALPGEVRDLLAQAGAPARLVAHLRLVRAVAATIVDWLEAAYPHLGFDRHDVLFGAATHDIGKAVHRDELVGPGHEHEHAGERYLLAHGVVPHRARYARTHASWDADDVELGDLIVSLADKAWKGARVLDLEDRLVHLIAQRTGAEPWSVFSTLDDLLTEISADADARVRAQGAFPA
ncbi:MAG: hypothetical protein FWE61_08405 [Micrococcales bacterium]|nr:hypothetical protein [Micrococcales bacterium]